MPAPGFDIYGEPTRYPGKYTSTSDNLASREVDPNKLKGHCYHGPDINLENLNWRVIDGPFISFWLQNVPWGSEDVMAAPNAQVGWFMCFLKYSLLLFLPLVFSS